MEAEQEGKADIRLQVVPIGAVAPEVLKMLKHGIAGILPADVRLGEALEPGIGAFNAERGQYSAEAILNDLAVRGSDDQSEHILGMADCDLYIPDLTFVFGAALGKAALISIARLKQEFYNLKADRDILRKRMMTEAVHEIGHSYGMRHCFDPGCVMFFSRTIGDTDRKGFNLCDRCGGMLSRLSKPLLEIAEDDPRLAPSLNIML